MKKNTLFIILISFTLAINAQVKYYINSNVGQPWGQNTNITSMNTVFGVGTWTQAFFETVNVNAMLQPTVCFIFVDGSDNNATALNTFLTANLPAIQNWVSAGGKLFLNAAPNVGGNINFGFGGTTLIYPGFAGTATNSPGMAAFPIFNGPAVPAGTSFTGGSYSHGAISGGISVPIMDGSSGSVATERFQGLGRVIFGGMTTTNFHNPQPNATNLRNNILSYLGGCCGASPSVTVTATSSMICAGQSVTLTASGATGGTYTFFPGNLTGTSVVISPSVSTNYNIVATPTAGCSGGTTIRVSVSVAPPTVAVSGGNTVICAGSSPILTAGGAITYSWNNGAVTNTIAPTPTANISYTVVGLNGCGSSTAVTSLTVSPSPSVSVSGNTLICGTGTNVLTASGANTYSWNTGITTASISLSPTVTTNYTVVGTNTVAGCTNTFTTSIVVAANPTVAITGGTAVVCQGSPVNLTASGAATYSWSNGAVTATIAPTPTANASYTVVGTNGCGSNTAVTNVTVNPTPVVSVAGSTLICGTGTNVLTANGANTYSWNNGATTSSISVSPTITTNYTVVGTNTVGNCTNTFTTSIIVSTNPTVAIAGGTAAVCAGSAINLTASGANTYSWSNGAATTTIAPTPTANASYTVVGTNTAGCTNSAVKAVTVTAAPSVSVAGASTICAGETSTLTASGANTYSWNTGSTSSSIVVTPTANATYTAYGTSTVTGCTGNITANIVVSPCTGLNSKSVSLSGLSVYPNPSNGEFIVELNNGLNKIIEVTDLTGRLVLTNTSSKDKVNVSMANLANGVYYLKVQSNNAVEVIKVIKQ